MKQNGKRFNWLAKVILDRGFSRGAEIGVARGNTARNLMVRCPSLHLRQVDTWAPVPNGDEHYRNWPFDKIFKTYQQRCGQWIKEGRLQVMRMTSEIATGLVLDGSLDFVFIDADHTYEGCSKDIQLWLPKVREGGLITGHDTRFPGVRKALDDHLPGWEEAGVDYCWFKAQGEVEL